MEHIIKVNDQSKAGKAFLEIARRLAETTKSIVFVEATAEEAKKITLDELIGAVNEEPLLSQLKAYRKKGVTDLRIIAKELGFTREDKEDFVMGVRMKEAEAEGLADTDEVLKKLGIAL